MNDRYDIELDSINLEIEEDNIIKDNTLQTPVECMLILETALLEIGDNTPF